MSTAPAPGEATGPQLDELELEARRLPGITFVGVASHDGVTVVQLLPLGRVDVVALRARAEQLCAVHLDGPWAVDILGPARPPRVQLLAVRTVDTDEGQPPEVEVHLAFGGQRTIGRAPAGDPAGAAAATVQALERLGAAVPFEVGAAAVFDHATGEGVMLILESHAAGVRYGVAAGRPVEEAAARATLHALNRFLAAQTFPEPAAAG